MAPSDSSMDSRLQKSIDTFHEQASKTGEDVIFSTFPQKILDLQALIDRSASDSSPFHLTHASRSTDATVYPEPQQSDGDSDSRKRRRTDGTDRPRQNGAEHARYPELVRANEHVQKVHGELKKECEELASLVDKLKLWVNLTMPKIEDGDNFGVQIQEEVLQELHRAQDSAYNIRDVCRQNHLNRAKICSKILKYPNVEDYTISLKEHDEKQLYMSLQHIHDLRNTYAVITDIFHKNIAKIRAPKANNSVGLY